MIFMRHPVTDAPEGMCYGRTDVGLGPDAPAQIAQALADTPQVKHIVCSPALRCRLLADQFVARDRATIQHDPRLWEHDFGDWEGMLWSDIPRADSEDWMTDLWNNACPNGERYRDLVARVREAIADLNETDLVICHAGVIRAAQIILHQRSFDDVFATKIPFAHPIEMLREPSCQT